MRVNNDREPVWIRSYEHNGELVREYKKLRGKKYTDLVDSLLTCDLTKANAIENFFKKMTELDNYVENETKKPHSGDSVSNILKKKIVVKGQEDIAISKQLFDRHLIVYEGGAEFSLLLNCFEYSYIKQVAAQATFKLSTWPYCLIFSHCIFLYSSTAKLKPNCSCPKIKALLSGKFVEQISLVALFGSMANKL